MAKKSTLNNDSLSIRLGLFDWLNHFQIPVPQTMLEASYYVQERPLL
jgi:hypothetical protein